MQNNPVHILVVEDNPLDVRLVKEYLNENIGYNYSLSSSDTLAGGLKNLYDNHFDVVLLDLNLPDSYGIDTFETLYSSYPLVPIILLTGVSDELLGIEAIKKGAQDYLIKGQINGVLLLRTIKYAIERLKNAQEIVRLNRLYNVLSNTNQTIVRVHDEKKLFEEICRIAVEDGKFISAWIEMRNPQDNAITIKAASGRGIEKQTTGEFLPIISLGEQVLNTGEHSIFEDLETTASISTQDASSVFHGYKSAASFPLMLSNRTIGCFNLCSSESNYFQSAEIKLLDEMALDISFALEFIQQDKFRTESDERKKLVNTILTIINRRNEWQHIVKHILQEIKKFAGVDAIGIRLKENDDFPYFETIGFPQNTVQTDDLGISFGESQDVPYFPTKHLHLKGICGRIISGEMNCDQSHYTQQGSFWTNSLSKMFEEVCDKEIQPLSKNPCNLSGYESVAFILLHSGDDVIGLLQLNDKLPNKFTVEFIEFLEEIGKTLGIAFKRMQHEKSIKESEQKFWEMYNYAPVGYHELDNQGRITQVNQKELEMLGYTREEMIGAFVWEFFDDKLSSKDRVLQKLRGITLPDEGMERTIRKKDGTCIFILVEDKIIRGGSGQISGIRSALQDITARKQAETQLVKLSMAVEQSPASIFITDIEGNIEYVNKTFTLITGYSTEDVLHKSPRILKSGYTSPEEYARLWSTIVSGNTWTGEFLNVKKNGETFWEEAMITPIKNDKGEIKNYLAIKRDITEYKRITGELLVAKEAAEEMNRLKSNFLANMSHELRTPMIGILGYSDILLDEAQDEQMKEIGEVIHSSGQRLMETLNLILDLSSIESKKIEIDRSPVNIVPVLQNVVNLFKAAAERKHLTLQFDTSYTSLISMLDVRMFREILNNLLNNAIKFTINGGVIISLTKETINNKDWAFIKVQDTGIGIAQENIQLIFEEFRQVSEGKSRSFEGTGLGLTITKNYVETLDGAITVESNLNAGSTFTVRFPLLHNTIQESGNEQQVSFTTTDTIINPTSNLPEILYVEDDPVAVKLVASFLKDICIMDTCSNSESALKK